ncbi:MAG TPA: peptidylprolyl isomerase [Candidatus Limnocylindria bacterium]|nr:peptidylprolyl isomerase [Candidatus Limnocylindria bacterium]
MRALLLSALLVASCGGAAQPATTLPVRTAAPTAAATLARTAAPTVAFPCPDGPPATKATIELVKGGAIVMQLRPDKARCTVANFAKNAREGKYDNLTFHRVERTPPFVIQGGDPLGNGTGGGNQASEFNDLPFTLGAVGIARGPDPKVSNLMQFFVCIGSCRHLDGQYTNFAQVTAGQEVANAVQVGDRMRTIRIE